MTSFLAFPTVAPSWWCRFGLSVVLAMPPVLAQVVPAIESRFDAGAAQGWTAQATSAFNGTPTGGNPGGCLFVDNNESGFTYLTAPTAFVGDLRSYFDGTLAFDGRMDPQSAGTASNAQYNYGVVAIVDGQGYRIYADAVPGVPGTQWTTYSLPLTPASFGVTQAVLDGYLANCTAILIGLEALNGPEAHWIDNVVLAAGPTPAAAQFAGSGCPSSVGANALVARTLPWIGTTAESRVYGVPYGIVLGVFGFASLPGVPLQSLFAQGIPGCSVHVSPDVLVAATPSGLSAGYLLGVPADPSLVGGQYWHQVVPVEFSPGGVLTAITASNALRMTMGMR